jgi:drug/metabolite transporter (DMT)-like permease
MIGQQGRQMTADFDRFAARAAPAIFVLLWSTGFIGTKYVVNNADPLTYLAIRMAIVVGLMAVICAIARPAWPSRPARCDSDCRHDRVCRRRAAGQS